jgi:uncharacterized damage-inducible protein DinB
MITDILTQLFKRDLNKLIDEINLYTKESNLWVVDKAISNSAGNLCLHLVGNLKSFIGANLGHSGYVRQRDLEFSQKNVPRTEMIKQVEETIAIVESTLKTLTVKDLEKEYAPQVFDKPMTTAYFLMHLSAHLSYHLGQINYHRRLLD